MADLSIAKNIGASGVGGGQGIGGLSKPVETIRNREATGAEFRKALTDSISQAMQPQAMPQVAGQPQVGGAESLKFSAHAVDRMKSRGISFAPDMMKGIESAVSRAAAKGSKDTLVLAGDNALIVSVKNNTVVTVMDKNAMRENVFTNIDSTVVV